MRKLVLALWSGDVPLAQVFWNYVILYGTLLNLLTTLASFTLVTVEGLEALAILVFLLPVPYNVLMFVAVWRSAGRYQGPQIWAQLARAIVAVWVVLASLA